MFDSLKENKKKKLKRLRPRNTEIKLKSLEEERKRKEEEEEEKERQIKKKEIFKRQLQLRKEQKLNQSKKVATNEEKVKEVLEDMCVLGSIMKEEIIEEKQKNPEKFISIEEATKEEKKNDSTFCLGLLAKNLENLGITTAIEKNANQEEESEGASNTVLQFIMNGMIEKKKYNLHFDLKNY